MIRFTSANRFLFACIITVLSMLPLVAAAQEIPCYELPECETPPPVPNQASVEFSPPASLWGGFSDERLNPEMAEYYSIWCLDNVVRVLRGVPTTALIDDIPIADVSSLPSGGSLTRASGLLVTRNNDSMIAVSGNNGNNTPQEGLKVFSLAECLERNGLSIPQPEITTDHELQQPIITFAQGNNNEGNDAPIDDFLASHPFARLVGWITEYVRMICAIPYVTVLMFPAGWSLWKRRHPSVKRRDQS